MSLTLLLDLDDTLLSTNLEAFVPAYFQALARDLAPLISPDLVFRALGAGMRLMNESDDFSRTLEEVFASRFYTQLNTSKGELDAAIENFYDNVFPALADFTSPISGAKPFVDWAFSQGYRIAIATDPLLPRKAAHHRLRWAGFEPDQFEQISSFEDFHFSKMHPAYYAELLGWMGWPTGPILMVGNDTDRDIIPAQKLGLATYHIIEEATSAGSITEAGPRGNLPGLRAWLESAELSTLTPVLRSMDSVLGILSATPATLLGITRELHPSVWTRSIPEDWSLTELICHWRDTEREVHPMQIKAFKAKTDPFISGPDASVWASQRDYLHDDGPSALDQFVQARKDTLTLLGEFSPEDWSRNARHAIFGPTNFLEVVGFMADHDRIHIQQAWSLLHKRG